MKISMVRQVLVLVAVVSSLKVSSVFALETRIQAVLAPETAGDVYRVFSTSDGRVYEASPTNAALVNTLRSLSPSQPVKLELKVDRVVSVQALAVQAARDYSDDLKSFRAPAPTALGYEPSRLASFTETRALFDSLQNLNPKSQCYQRAELWSYQLWSQRSIKSMKVFLFFTQRFIRNYHYKWWFHVAPFVYAENKEVVLDPTFTDEPMEMANWTNEFVYSHAFCPEAATYGDYSNNQMVQDCYTLKLPMYYYQPQDAEALDQGVTVLDWVQLNLSQAAGARKRGWWPF